MTRAELLARVSRAEGRLATLTVETEEFYNLSRYSGGEDEAGRNERAAYNAQYLLYSGEKDECAKLVRDLHTEYDALCELLRANVLKASRAVSDAMDHLLQAECDARDAGEHDLATDIVNCKKRLVNVGVTSQLFDSI